jgi:hypothetical protein
MNTASLLERYYSRLKDPEACADLLAEDFTFVGGDMTKLEPVVGKEPYVAILKRLSPRFADVRIEQMFIDGNRAAVVARYGWTFPQAGLVPGSVAEFWTVKDDRLQALTIFFDTGTFDRLAKG